MFSLTDGVWRFGDAVSMRKLDRNVFLCGGTLEDEDYRTSYRGFDTTLEGVEKLKTRLEKHHVNITYKLYESHHYQYISAMPEERISGVAG